METRMSVGTLAGTVAADDATIETRVASLDWPHIASDLDARGSAVIAGLLASHECAALAALYDEDGRFRSRVVMARHGFGRGEYRYFAYPLPDAVARLRTAVYPPIAAVANRWTERMALGAHSPAPPGTVIPTL